MKVLYVTVPDKGGANFSLLHSINSFEDNNIECVFVTSNKDAIHFFETKGYNCYCVPMILSIWPKLKTVLDYFLFIPRLLKMILVNALAPLRIIKIIREERIDLVHTNISLLNAGYWASRSTHVPHVWHIREYGDIDFGYKHFPTKAVKTRMLQKSSSIAITKDLYRYFCLGDKGKVIYNGVLSSNYKVDNKMQKEPFFLFVGTLIEGKGCDELLECFAQFTRFDSKYRLLYVGGGNDKYISKLHDITNKHSIDDRVSFLGRRDDVYELMQRATVLVVPSKNEGFGRITAEAMFNRCLVIGKNTAGTKEQFDNGYQISGKEIGLRYISQNDLVERMRDVIAMDNEEENAMLERANDVVKRLYSVEVNRELILDFYKKIIAI